MKKRSVTNTAATVSADQEYGEAGNAQSLPWWSHPVTEPQDPWDYIALDLAQGLKLVDEGRKRGIQLIDVAYGGWPEKTSASYRAQYGLSLMYLLRPEVEFVLSNEEPDAFAMWLWGEYQKAMAIFEGSLPGFDQRKPLKNKVRTKAMQKSLAREWYVLWYDWFCESGISKRPSREAFNRHFAKILLDIRDGRRRLPAFPTKKEMKEIINFYTTDPKNKDSLVFTEFFTTKFTGEEFKAFRIKANKNRLILPLVGDENYPKIGTARRT